MRKKLVLVDKLLMSNVRDVAGAAEPKKTEKVLSLLHLS